MAPREATHCGLRDKRALGRLGLAPATSDVRECPRCSVPMAARACLVEGAVIRSWPVCPVCRHTRKASKGDARRGTKPALLRLGRVLNDARPTPKPRVVVVRRRDPGEEVVTGLRAKLAARNLWTWEEPL